MLKPKISADDTYYVVYVHKFDLIKLRRLSLSFVPPMSIMDMDQNIMDPIKALNLAFNAVR